MKVSQKDPQDIGFPKLNDETKVTVVELETHQEVNMLSKGAIELLSEKLGVSEDLISKNTATITAKSQSDGLHFDYNEAMTLLKELNLSEDDSKEVLGTICYYMDFGPVFGVPDIILKGVFDNESKNEEREIDYNNADEDFNF